jgi:hypothetical protein
MNINVVKVWNELAAKRARRAAVLDEDECGDATFIGFGGPCGVRVSVGE